MAAAAKHSWIRGRVSGGDRARQCGGGRVARLSSPCPSVSPSLPQSEMRSTHARGLMAARSPLAPMVVPSRHENLAYQSMPSPFSYDHGISTMMPSSLPPPLRFFSPPSDLLSCSLSTAGSAHEKLNQGIPSPPYNAFLIYCSDMRCSALPLSSAQFGRSVLGREFGALPFSTRCAPQRRARSASLKRPTFCPGDSCLPVRVWMNKKGGIDGDGKEKTANGRCKIPVSFYCTGQVP